jgi:very-short-patch-repair endonuclease
MPFASRSEIERARRLRSEQTDAERCLWMRLRGKQVEGHRFRRQVPIGPYVADFACISRGLVVEIDGGQHAKTVSYDKHRSAYLATLGYRVLRFWDNEVLNETDGVLEAIRTALRS